MSHSYSAMLREHFSWFKPTGGKYQTVVDSGGGKNSNPQSRPHQMGTCNVHNRKVTRKGSNWVKSVVMSDNPSREICPPLYNVQRQKLVWKATIMVSMTCPRWWFFMDDARSELRFAPPSATLLALDLLYTLSCVSICLTCPNSHYINKMGYKHIKRTRPGGIMKIREDLQ